MDSIYDKTFTKLTPGDFKKAEYEKCIFVNCDFSGVDLSGAKFIECEFKGCGLSLVKVAGTTINDVIFRDCKMLGFRFDLCHQLALSFTIESCALNDTSFFKCKLKKTVFNNSQLHHCDFGQTDLSESKFNNCDLKDAMFENTNLSKADFRTAYNYTIDPDVNIVKKAKFSKEGLAGLLDKYDIEVL
jgi:uncharacterized protein YjbI with pentapeptide repeats